MVFFKSARLTMFALELMSVSNVRQDLQALYLVYNAEFVKILQVPSHELVSKKGQRQSESYLQKHF